LGTGGVGDPERRSSLSNLREKRGFASRAASVGDRSPLGPRTVFFVLDMQTPWAIAEFALALAQTNDQTAVATVEHAAGKFAREHHQLQITTQGVGSRRAVPLAGMKMMAVGVFFLDSCAGQQEQAKPRERGQRKVNVQIRK